MFTLQIPHQMESMREGLETLHRIYQEQEEWIWGVEVTEHAQLLLHREPTLQERVLIWIIWSGGLKLFWNKKSEAEMKHMQSVITPAHFIIYQVLFANQDPTHRWFVLQDFGYFPDSGDKIVWHFTRNVARQFRFRFGPAIGIQ